MKSFIWIPLTFIAGLVVGNWGPHSQLQKVRQELDVAQTQLKVHDARRNLLPGVSGLLGIGTSSTRVEPERSVATPKTAPSVPAGDPSVAAADAGTNAVAAASNAVAIAAAEGTNATPEAADAGADTTGEERGGMSDIERAAELWDMRVKVARSTFLANTKASAEQSAQFDSVIEQMNGAIETTITEFAAEVKDAEMVQMEAGIRLANDITDVLVQSYDAVDETLPEGWRRDAGEEFSLVNFIDPRVGKPMVGLEDKMRPTRGRRGRPRRLIRE